MTKLSDKMKAAVEAALAEADALSMSMFLTNGQLHEARLTRILAAVASGMEEAKPTVQLLWALPGDPFNRFDCVVTDIGHADNILTVECPEAVKLASLAPALNKISTQETPPNIARAINENLFSLADAKASPAQGTDGKECKADAEKIVIELLEYDNMDFNDEEQHHHDRRVRFVQGVLIARHCPPSAPSLPADEGTKCQGCGGTGIARSIGRDNDEIISDCDCVAAAPKDGGWEKKIQTMLELYARYGMYRNDAQLDEAYRIKRELVEHLTSAPACVPAGDGRDKEVTQKDADRWHFVACSPQTALMLGSNVDPNQKDFPWREEPDRLVDSLRTAQSSTQQGENPQ